MEKEQISEVYGSMVFNDAVMKETLPDEIYRSLRRSMETGDSLDLTVANAVAAAMKSWALDKGATHFTHWFQPMTGITAEKHESFLSPQKDGRAITEFSGSELIKGEPDASEFPSGGLRTTFEARGYTAWDPTSYAFIKDGSLCIPTAFCSYGGESLDKKTPLLRSMDAVNVEALRVLRLLGDTTTKRVIVTVGPEQEYFLIDKKLWQKRRDLIYCGRTLFGAKPPKGQELAEHYFGVIQPRIAAFMADVDRELWKLGVPAKTEHNEAAPAQHELAIHYTTANKASDYNQLTMETLKKCADRHGLVCLLHEKPFAGLNGSGKHNNWSLATDRGINLYCPGQTREENLRFLIFLAAMIQGVDEYQDLLRLSVASAGNDLRLGGSEAPPTILSMYLGEPLTRILEAIENGADLDGEVLGDGSVRPLELSNIPKDATDQNRTSPFAFTGNKFEFRMLGSSLSIAGPNIILNTIVAEELHKFADQLEASGDVSEEALQIVRQVMRQHKRIIYNGDGYSASWRVEAARRGLSHDWTTVDALPHFTEQRNVELFARHHVFTEREIHSRTEILLETYNKVIHIEALTMVDMVRKDVIPAVSRYMSDLSQTILAKKQISDKLSSRMEIGILDQISAASDSMYHKVEELEEALLQVREHRSDSLDASICYREVVFPAMQELRISVDKLESLSPSDVWPYPTYGELLYNI